MNPKALFVTFILSLGGVAAAAPTPTQGTRDGLVAVHTRNLDQFHRLPDAKLASFRRIIIDPVQVEFHPGWLKNMNDSRHVDRIRPEDVQRIREDTAAGMAASVAAAFEARGYQIAAAPEAGVLRLTPRVVDLYVNAPDIYPPGLTRSFVREAGDATLVLEARDALSGALVARVVDGSAARTVSPHLSRSNSVSNQFWFDNMFQRWAANCVAAFAAGPDAPAR